MIFCDPDLFECIFEVLFWPLPCLLGIIIAFKTYYDTFKQSEDLKALIYKKSLDFKKPAIL